MLSFNLDHDKDHKPDSSNDGKNLQQFINNAFNNLGTLKGRRFFIEQAINSAEKENERDNWKV